ncbi:MAG: S46 family peptidase [Owenweeksia sp.]|nr:S46 family peptidase [Owenweeksia sp.]
MTSFLRDELHVISVDARYILFIIDKYAGAQNLIDELTLVKNGGAACR